MKIPTFRFILYVLVMMLSVPLGSGSIAVVWGFLYYIWMIWLTLIFMRMDGIWIRFWIPDMKSGVLKGLKVFPLFFAVVFLVNLIFPIKVVPEGEHIPLGVLALLSLSLAPVAEEFMFRGYIQEYLRQRLKVEMAVILSALFFSLFHPLEYFPQIFVVGVFLSALREYTNSLLPGIVVHALNNTLALLGFLFSSN